MSDLDYSWASWRIEIAKGAFVEIHVRGCRGDSDKADLSEDVTMAGRVLVDISGALQKVRDRWIHTTEVDE